MNKEQVEFFGWLPVGYMVETLGQVPMNFIEVDGQRLLKQQYQDLFETMRGTVQEDGDGFILPKKQQLQHLFPEAIVKKSKIILKLHY